MLRIEGAQVSLESGVWCVADACERACLLSWTEWAVRRQDRQRPSIAGQFHSEDIHGALEVFFVHLIACQQWKTQRTHSEYTLEGQNFELIITSVRSIVWPNEVS
jgi:hypothetical protein